MKSTDKKTRPSFGRTTKTYASPTGRSGNPALRVVLLVVVLVLGLSAMESDLVADTLRINSVALANLRFPVPDQPEELEYLGVPATGQFGLAQIKAKVILLEILYMYCPVCHGEASKVNDLYYSVKANKELNGKVKFIGIGAGNTPFELDLFRKKFSVPFPLLADDDSIVQNTASEQIQTPTFLLLSIRKVNSVQVAGIYVGAIKNQEEILKRLSELATAE